MIMADPHHVDGTGADARERKQHAPERCGGLPVVLWEGVIVGDDSYPRAEEGKRQERGAGDFGPVEDVVQSGNDGC